jgi:hypothetical protein
MMPATHSENNAIYGIRTIQLRDGWMVDEKDVDRSAVARMS